MLGLLPSIHTCLYINIIDRSDVVRIVSDFFGGRITELLLTQEVRRKRINRATARMDGVQSNTPETCKLRLLKLLHTATATRIVSGARRT